MFISETVIDKIVEQLDHADHDKIIDAFAEDQPEILAYLLSEDSEMFSENEQELLMYLAIVIWQSVMAAQPSTPLILTHIIEEHEEKNWDAWENSKGKTFRDRLNVFFDKTDQEDLLAFIEDSLIDDEDEPDPITDEGREFLFMTLKTVVDCLTKK
jgi:hypothetical protein